MTAYYHSHEYGYDSMNLDIITYMDLDMAPCLHITGQSGYGSMSTYYCSHGYGYGSLSAYYHSHGYGYGSMSTYLLL